MSAFTGNAEAGTGIGQAPERIVRQAFPAAVCKTIHWIRHAEATSNEAASDLVGDARQAAYGRPKRVSWEACSLAL